MTGRPRRGVPSREPVPLTPQEVDDARAVVRDELERLRITAAEQLAEAQRALEGVEAEIGAFERDRTLSDDLGLRVVAGLSEASQTLGSKAAFRGGDPAEFREARRRELLVGRHLREIGNPYMKEFGK